MSTAAQIMASHEQKRARMALRRTLSIRRAERHTDINPSARSVSVEAAPEWSRLLGVPVAPGTPTAALPHGHELDEVKALTPSQRSGYLKLRSAGGTHERALADAKTLPGGGGSREGRDLGDVASRIESAAKTARPAKKAAPRKAPAKKAGALAGLPPLVPRTEWSGWDADQHETYARDRMRALSDPEVSARVSPALRQSVEKDARQHFAIAATMRKKAETPAPAKKAGRETPLQQATAEARQARQAREAEAKAARVRGAEDQLRQSHAKPPAKKAAPPRKGTPERDALDKAMVRDYTRGASLSEVAEKHGVSAAFVHESLTTQGVQLRGRGAPRAKRAPSRRAGITPHEFESRHDAGTRAGLSDAEAAKYARSDFDSPKAWREAHPAKASPAKALDKATLQHMSDAELEREHQRGIAAGVAGDSKGAAAILTATGAERERRRGVNAGVTPATRVDVEAGRGRSAATGELLHPQSHGAAREAAAARAKEKADRRAARYKEATAAGLPTSQATRYAAGTGTLDEFRAARPAKATGATPTKRAPNRVAIEREGRALLAEADGQSIEDWTPEQHRDYADRLNAMGDRVYDSGAGVALAHQLKDRAAIHRTKANVKERKAARAAGATPRAATPGGARKATGAARPETPRMRALREGLTPTEANLYVKWLKDHPNGSVSDWQQARREGGGTARRLRDMGRLSDEALAEARRVAPEVGYSTDPERISQALQGFNAAELLRIADAFNVTIPASARTVAERRGTIAFSAASANRRNRGGI